MAFKLRKISGKPDPFASSLDNFLRIAIRPDDAPLTRKTDEGEYQEVGEFDYLKEAIFSNKFLNDIFTKIQNFGINVDDLIGKLAFSLMDIGAKLSENKEDIEALIESLRAKKPIAWNSLPVKERTRILDEQGFEGITPPVLRKTNEYYPLTRQEIKSLQMIGEDLFEKAENGEFVGLQERMDLAQTKYTISQLGEQIRQQLQQKIEEKIQAEATEVSSYEWSEPSLQEEVLSEKRQQLEMAAERIVEDFSSGRVATVLQEVLETQGADIPGSDYPILESIAPMFSLTGFISKADLENFIENLDTVLNPVRAGSPDDPDQYKLMHPENIPTLRVGEQYDFQNKIHTIKGFPEDGMVETDHGVYFYDDFSRNSKAITEQEGKQYPTAPGREVEREVELKMQENWDSLIGSFDSTASLDQANAFLNNYGISVDDVLSVSLPSFDQNNPRPSEKDITNYNNWQRRKLIAFVQTAQIYAQNAPTLLRSQSDLFPSDISNAMIGIAGGIQKANQQGLNNINLTIEDPFGQFPGLNRIVNAFKGNINEVYRRFKFDPNQEYSSNTDRIRIQKLVDIFNDLNEAANSVDKTVALMRDEMADEDALNEYRVSLPRYIVSLRENFLQFTYNFNPLIGIRSNTPLDSQKQKYKSNGITAVTPEDLAIFSRGFSNYEGSVAIEMLNSLNSSAQKITTILDTLEKRSDRKPQKEVVVKLKNTLSDIKIFLKNYTGDESDRKQLDTYLTQLKQDFNVASGSALSEEQKQQRTEIIREMNERRKARAFNVKKLLKKAQEEQNIADRYEGISNVMPRPINSLGVLIENPKTLSDIKNGIEEIIVLLQSGLTSTSPGPDLENASKAINKVITLLKEASDEYLGINESAIGSEEATEFRILQNEIANMYDEIIRSSIDESADPETIKQMGESIVELAKKGLPLLEGLLSDFWNLESSDREANVAYRGIQSVADDLPSLFNTYGDFRLNHAELEAEEEAIRLNTEKAGPTERSRKIKTESGFDPDTQTVTFYDIKSTKSSTFREGREYEIGDPRLERALVSRKLLSLEPQGSSGFFRSVYQDTYQDPADVSKGVSDPFTTTVVYSVPQNPTVLNRILSQLEDFYKSGEIKYPADLKKKLIEISGDLTDDGVIGQQVSKFVDGLISANQDTETVSRDLFDSLVISNIYDTFASNPEQWGNALTGSANLDAAIDKAISVWSGDPKYESMALVLKKMQENPKLKDRLLQYGRTGNAFATDIRKERKGGRETPFDTLKKYVPEIVGKIDVAIESLPDSFVYDPVFVKMVGDIVSNKKSEAKFKNLPALFEEAQESTKNSIKSLIGYVSSTLDKHREGQDDFDTSEEYESKEEGYQETSDYGRGPRGIEDEEERGYGGDYEDYQPSWQRESSKFNLKRASNGNKIVFNLKNSHRR